jgi:tetratricopeptide (TPR) repeat protein
MRLFASIFCLALGLAVLPAAAQSPAPAKPPGDAAPPAERKPSTLDELFERLAKAKDETEGKGVASLIERRWARSGSDTADLLMSRANQAAERKDFPLAIELLDRVIALEPNWIEAWYRRANVFYMLDDPVSAMADIRKVLEREPRHFGAWAGLGHIFMASEDKSRALEAFRRALKIHPQVPNLKTMVERLTPQVDGLDL